MKASSNFFLIPIVLFISILIINPSGEFPLNDDWSYAKSVLILCEQGKMTIDSWAAMTLVAQIGWGALFCKLFGFSFFTLRVCTLITALLGLFAFYQIALSISLNKKLTLFATLVLCFNPIFFCLSFTFMTDVHFFSFSIISILFYLKYIEKENFLYIFLATIFSIIAVLIRQPGIIFPLAYTLSVFYKNRNIKVLLKSSLPFLLTLTALVLHALWLKNNQYGQNVVGIENIFSSFIYLFDPYHLLLHLSCSILFCGFFLLPISILYWKKIEESVKQYITQYKFKVLYFLTPVITLLLVGGVHYPSGNILYNLGLGPKTLKDGYREINVSPILPEQLWIVALKLFSIIGILMVFLLLNINSTNNNVSKKENIYPNTSSQIKFFMWIIIGIYLFLLLINRMFFDRHVILLVALLSLLILSPKIEYTPLYRNIAIGCLLIMASFSIGSTHDYLSWNRARWEATNYLNNELKISMYRIDGGFEYHAWYDTGGPSKYSSDINQKSWWWVVDDEYVIAFGDINGYKKFKTFSYPQLLTFQKGHVFILKRE